MEIGWLKNSSNEFKRYRVTVPEGERDGWKIERFEIPQEGMGRVRYMMQGRDPGYGTFTRLKRNGRIWMSDTNAEILDHLPVIQKIEEKTTRRVLITGLGLGMVLGATLRCPHVEHVDVIEIDRSLIELVGPHYTADPRLAIHLGDAYEYKWPSGVKWDVVWHDIWPDITIDNLAGMKILKKKYAQRSGWVRCWAEHECRKMKVIEDTECRARELMRRTFA
jgi:spermidine synthase